MQIKGDSNSKEMKFGSGMGDFKGILPTWEEDESWVKSLVYFFKQTTCQYSLLEH